MSDETYEFVVGRPPQLILRVPSGRVTVRVGEPDAVRVEIRSKDAADFSVEQNGNEISVRYLNRRSLVNASHDVEVTAPAGSHLSAQTASADVSAEGSVGDLRVVTASGDVRADSTLRGGEVKTASGDVAIGHAGDRIRVRTASGDVAIGTADSDASVTTASGDVRVEGSGGTLTIKTASGECFVRRFDGSALSVKTVSSNVRVGLAPNRTVAIDLQSLTGAITLPNEPGRPDGIGGRHLKVRVRTISGDVAFESVP